MKKELIARLHGDFEQAAHLEDGVEFWLARELQPLLGYTRWENFEQVIRKATTACETAGYPVADHFRDVTKMVGIGSGSDRKINDLALTRYACCLIAHNGDPRKDAIAFAQTYFAVQTRKQELIAQRLAEVEGVQARETLTVSQKALPGVMFERGVDQQGFGRILSKGDAALFGGMTTQHMKKRWVCRPRDHWRTSCRPWRSRPRTSPTRSLMHRSRSTTCTANPASPANTCATTKTCGRS